MPKVFATRMFAIRHAEAEWNVEGRAMGHLDSPLTPRGVEQAQAVAARLSGVGVQALYSSDLGRARRTAAFIAEACDIEARSDSGLRERHLGILQGLTVQEIRRRFPEEWRRLVEDSFEYVVPDGESVRQCKERSVRVMTEIARRHRTGPIAVVTHGRFLMGFFEHVLSVPPGNEGQFRRSNTGLNVFDYVGDRWRLETWNDTSHLAGLVTAEAPIPSEMGGRALT